MFCKPCSVDLCDIHNVLFMQGSPLLLKRIQEIFGEKLLHQYCLFHLNKLIVKDFPRKSTIAQMLLKYKLYNIFYNHEKEIELLSKLEVKERSIIRNYSALQIKAIDNESTFDSFL